MKKTVALLFVLLLCVALCLVACNTDTEEKQFEGITLSSKTVDYDGKKHSLTVEGDLPRGAKVAYTYDLQGVDNDNIYVSGVSEVGVYKVKAKLTCSGYQSRTLSATLTIVKPSFDSKLHLQDADFQYDGKKHKLQIVGNVPQGTQVAYTYIDQYNYNADPITDQSGVADLGRYVVVVTLSKAGYDTVTLTGTLEIWREEFLQKDSFSLPNKTVTFESGKEYSIDFCINGQPAEEKDIKCAAILHITYLYNGQQVNSVSEKGVYSVQMIIFARGYKTVTLKGTLTVE